MTDDDRIDELLRAWGSERRTGAPDVRPTPRTAEPERNRGRWIAVVSAAALVIVLSVALVLAGGGSSPKSAGEATQPAATSSPPPTETTQQVTYHHLAITVPASWQINDERCGTPQSNTVLLPGGTLGCAVASPSNVTWVAFGRDQDSLANDATREETTLDGASAIKWTGVTKDGVGGFADGVPALVLDVPSADPSVLIASPDRQELDRLASAVHVVNSASDGCPSEEPYRALTDEPMPDHAGADEQLIPGEPASLIVCAYDGEHQLGGSGVVTGEALTSDVAMLRALPSGLSRAPDNSYDHGSCTQTADPSKALDRDPEAYFIVLARYDSGAVLKLYVRVGTCGDLGVTNGTVTGQLSADLVRFVATVTRTTVTSPMNVHPAP